MGYQGSQSARRVNLIALARVTVLPPSLLDLVILCRTLSLTKLDMFRFMAVFILPLDCCAARKVPENSFSNCIYSIRRSVSCCGNNYTILQNEEKWLLLMFVFMVIYGMLNVLHSSYTDIMKLLHYMTC